MAKKAPVARLTDKEFDTPDEAAAWVSSVFNPLSIEDDIEFGGGIIKNPKSGKYYVTYNPGEEGIVDIRVLKPKDHELAGFWHTHGGHGPKRRLFSPGDVKTVKRTKLPFYMAAHDGSLQVLRADRKHHMATPGDKVLGADGQPISIRTKREQGLFEPVRLPQGALVAK